MTATQTLPAVADNRRRGPTVPHQAVWILLMAVVLLSGARELVGLWQQVADRLAQVGADAAARGLTRGFELAGEAGLSVPRLSELAALEVARTTIEGVLSCLFLVAAVCYASGLVVAVGPLAWARAAWAGACLPAAL
jgi:hypothetical protein